MSINDREWAMFKEWLTNRLDAQSQDIAEVKENMQRVRETIEGTGDTNPGLKAHVMRLVNKEKTRDGLINTIMAGGILSGMGWAAYGAYLVIKHLS
jgi:hypothetical protein